MKMDLEHGKSEVLSVSERTAAGKQHDTARSVPRGGRAEGQETSVYSLSAATQVSTSGSEL